MTFEVFLLEESGSKDMVALNLSVPGQYLSLEAYGFPRTSLSENCLSFRKGHCLQSNVTAYFCTKLHFWSYEVLSC